MVSALVRWPTVRDPARGAAWLRRIVGQPGDEPPAAAPPLRNPLAAAAGRPRAGRPAPTRPYGEKQRLAALGGPRWSRCRGAPERGLQPALHLEGLSLDEVADSLGVERGTARVPPAAGVRKLRGAGLLGGGEP
jgi:hypothetical protein